MKENLMIISVTLRGTRVKDDLGSQMNQERPVCYLKIKEAEVTFYNGVNKHILHAVLAEISRYAR